MRVFSVFLLSFFFLPIFICFLSMQPTNGLVFMGCTIGFILLSAMEIASAKESEFGFRKKVLGIVGGFVVVIAGKLVDIEINKFMIYLNQLIAHFMRQL
jgi:phosphotransferase system  glucose/maltose/N-acetylglucosamine-specific IIC component